MSAISVHDTVGEVVARHPALSRTLEAVGVDYCCGGKRTFEEACRQKGLDPQAFVAQLEQAAAEDGQEPVIDAAAMDLAELADHIEQTHHAWLREELPRLEALTSRVASVHGDEDPRLVEVRETLHAMSAELTAHMAKEELILFPIIRKLAASETLPVLHCGSVANPIRQMELEHHDAGDALERMRTLTDEYTPPSWACNTYRAMLEALDRLERDMHQHVHKEDNVLFPKAAQLEATLAEWVHA